MIENRIFECVQQTALVPGTSTEEEYIEKIEDLADEFIDGSNIRRARVFATQLYRYCVRSNRMTTPLISNDFGNVLGVCV